MPRNDQFPNYKGISVKHSGEWDALSYHHPDNTHTGSLQKTSEERAFKPKPRSKDFNKPKPTTKRLDLATGKAYEVDTKLNEALDKDLKQRNLKH